MGQLIKTFVFERNALKRSALLSAQAVYKDIQTALLGSSADKVESNRITVLKNYLGVLTKEDTVSTIGHAFLRLYGQNKEDAFRWLITRALWLYTIPNGTLAQANRAARDMTISFSFFRLILGWVMHLSALSGDERYLYYEELCDVLVDDAAWNEDPKSLFDRTVALRESHGGFVPRTRRFLEDLEDSGGRLGGYGIHRDNFNTIFNKAFSQTSLFEYARHNGSEVGIGLSFKLDDVLQERVRFILDNAVEWTGNGSDDWREFLQSQVKDLPEVVSLSPPDAEWEELPDQSVEGLVQYATEAFATANIQLDGAMVHRFASSLLAKRFVILTGLSGSGKTKLAQAFAQWITPKSTHGRDFLKTMTTIVADGESFRVVATDQIGAELENEDGKRFVIAHDQIDQWAECIKSFGYDAATPKETLLHAARSMGDNSDLSELLALPLKAAALSLVATDNDAVAARHYEVIAVGADWLSKESLLGYADALTENKYVRTTPALDLILRAQADNQLPYFLILDEMNLSHVERYFADFLSSVESDEEIVLHGRDGEIVDGVPASINLPANLFVIGTVNVDETTYTFSPKVLDRANSIEFRVTDKDMSQFLENPVGVSIETIDGLGRQFARSFVSAARQLDVLPSKKEHLAAELMLFFDALAPYGVEFGFRTAKEVSRFFFHHEQLTVSDWLFKDALDVQISQKILPKLNGSYRKLEGILKELSVLCYHEHLWDAEELKITNRGLLLKTAKRFATGEIPREEAEPPALPRTESSETSSNSPASETVAYGLPFLPISYEKINRMLTRASAEGFTSFAEA